MGGLILPKAQTRASSLIVEKADAIVQPLPQSVDHNAWLAAVVSEVNQLGDDVNAASIAKAVYGLAYLGLMPGPVLGHAYLVPFFNKKKNVKECSLIPGYRGFISLAYESGYLSTVHANVVCDGELFESWVDENGPHFKHIPDMLNRNPSRQNIVAAYVVYKTMSGGNGMRFVTKPEIAAVDSKSNVWNSDYAAMAMKTAIRRAAKEWKITGRMGYAVRIDEQYERLESQDAAPSFSGIEDTTDKRKTSRLPQSLPEETVDAVIETQSTLGELAERLRKRIEDANGMQLAQLALEIGEFLADGGLTQQEADELTAVIRGRQ